MASTTHDAVKWAQIAAQAAAMPGLRKNLKVSKPSMDASFHTPPNAEIQPNTLPTVTTTSQVGASGHCLLAQRSRKNSAKQMTATTRPMPMRSGAFFIGEVVESEVDDASHVGDVASAAVVGGHAA